MTKQKDFTYPLMENCPQLIRPVTGRSMSELTLESVLSGKLDAEDGRISSETLQMQAEVAETHGYRQVAGSLRRASELVNVPDTLVLETYNMMRPYRADEEELLAIADQYETEFTAPLNAAFIREAAQVLKERKLQKRDRGTGDRA